MKYLTARANAFALGLVKDGYNNDWTQCRFTLDNSDPEQRIVVSTLNSAYHSHISAKTQREALSKLRQDEHFLDIQTLPHAGRRGGNENELPL